MRITHPTTLATLLLAVGMLASAGPGEAADETAPAFDCGRAFGDVEEMICGDPALAALDRRITRRFANAVRSLRQGEDAKAAVKALRAEQRGWISGRNECWKAEDMRSCTEDAYLTREGELTATYLLESPVATASYACNDNPADAFDAAFFETALPSVRVERGDSIATGSLAPSASGSRYALPFGRELWIKGEEATLVWPEGEQNTCRRIAGG
ncbi:MAG: MliC family protein [Pseudomonadota bacterium]